MDWIPAISRKMLVYSYSQSCNDFVGQYLHHIEQSLDKNMHGQYIILEYGQTNLYFGVSILSLNVQN